MDWVWRRTKPKLDRVVAGQETRLECADLFLNQMPVVVAEPYLRGRGGRDDNRSTFRRAPLAARRPASRCSVARALRMRCLERLQTANTGRLWMSAPGMLNRDGSTSRSCAGTDSSCWLSPRVMSHPKPTRPSTRPEPLLVLPQRHARFMVSAGGLGPREEIDVDTPDSACAEFDVAGPRARIKAAFALASNARDEGCGHRLCRALGENTCFWRSRVGDVADCVDIRELGLQCSRVHGHPAGLGHSAGLDHCGRAVLGHAQEQVIGQLASVVERRDAAARVN